MITELELRLICAKLSLFLELTKINELYYFRVLVGNYPLVLPHMAYKCVANRKVLVYTHL